MTGLEMWEIIFKPIVQFLIGPIITGMVIFWLTNRATKTRERNHATRQLNVLKAKLERVVYLVEQLNPLLEENDNYSKRLKEMTQGNFSIVREETEPWNEGDEKNVIRLYGDLQLEAKKQAVKLGKQLTEVTTELKEIPMDSLPTKIHGKLHELIEMKKVELDLVKVNSLLILVNKEI